MSDQQDDFPRNRDWRSGDRFTSRNSLNSWGSVTDKFQRDRDASFDRLTSFGNMTFSDGVRSNCLASVKRFLDGHGLFHIWNEMSVALCVFAVSLDPLFCYILVINEEKKCVGWDKKLKIISIVLRSITDFAYVILLIFRFQIGYISLPSDPSKRTTWVITKRYLSSNFPIDILSVLPLPQMVLLISPKFDGSGILIGIKSLKIILSIQYVARVLRIFSFLGKVTWSSGIFPERARSKAALNLFLYMLSSHVLGAFWYLNSIERKTTCWQEACRNQTGLQCSWSCNDHISLSHTFMKDHCSENEENKKPDFDFGIFNPALESGVLSSRDFIKKLSFCFWWGLQNVSSLGQNLKPSTYIWEIYFSVIICTSGLLLFAFLIGNLQTYLQTRTARMEEMRLKGQDIELWMAFHSLPRHLKKRIKRYEQFKWRNTKGIDVENLLLNLPRDLRRDTKRHLCSDTLARVPLLRNMDDRLFDAICEYLKPVLYIEHGFIIREGEPLDEMIFITRGRVWTYTNRSSGTTSSSSGTKCLTKGEFYGEDLLTWALNNPFSSSVPVSTRTVRAHTKVEAFILTANDLKSVVSKFWWLFSRELKNSTSFREKWAPWAAFVLQAAWRRYFKNKVAQQLANESENSRSLGVTVYASGFVARALGALKSRSNVNMAPKSSPESV